MKKILLIITVLSCSLFQANAQCTITPGCTPDPNSGFCSTPSATTSLPSGMVGVAYSTSIQLSVGTSAAGGLATITSAVIQSMTGLPTGLTAAINPTGSIAAGGSGCVLISGTPGAGTAGSYTLTGTILAQTSFGPQTGQAPYFLTISPSTVGFTQLSQPANLIFVSPNPAKSELSVSTDFYISKVSVIDALGKVVISQDVNYTSQTTLDIRNLERGVYFLQANDGTRLVTKKFIKD